MPVPSGFTQAESFAKDDQREFDRAEAHGIHSILKENPAQHFAGTHGIESLGSISAFSCRVGIGRGAEKPGVRCEHGCTRCTVQDAGIFLEAASEGQAGE